MNSVPLASGTPLCGVTGGEERASFICPSEPDEQLQRLCNEGQLDKGIEMLLGVEVHGNVPSQQAFSTILRACSRRRALPQARRVHAQLVRQGLESTIFLGEFMVSTFVQCGGLDEALHLFFRLPQRTVFAWTAVISGYTSSKQGQEALSMYRCMQEEGVKPNTYTFVSLLKACSITSDLEEGKHIHAEALKYRCSDDPHVCTGLVDMYAKCGSFLDAWNVFSSLAQKSVVLWNAMLAACSHQGHATKALQLYEEMQQEGVSPDVRTFVSVLQACSILAEEEKQVNFDGRLAKLESLENGKALHAFVLRKGYDLDAFVASTLIRLYGICGSVADSQEVFDRLHKPDVVSWTSLLATYVHHGQPERALDLYRQMQQEGENPDVRTIVSAIQACGMLAEREEKIVVDGVSISVRSLAVGKLMHADASRYGFISNVFIGSSLIGMYGKCGSILDAECVFDRSSQTSVVFWNAMLSAYVDQRQADKAWQLYREMKEHDVSPNEITKICIVQACSNIGSLEICRQFHRFLLLRATVLSPLLANSLINAYGKCSSMVDAQGVFDTLLQPDVVSWTTLIAGYAREGKTKMSLGLYQEMLLSGVRPNAVTFLSVLCACNHAGLVDMGVEFFESMYNDYGILPHIEHYACVIDLLGRAGYFRSLQHLLTTMPVKPDLAVWICVLHSCRMHGKVVLGEKAFHCAVVLAPRHPAAYVLMLNMYLDAGLWQHAKGVREMRLNADARKLPGETWIEYGHEIHSFVVRDLIDPQHGRLHDLLEELGADGDEAALDACNCSEPYEDYDP